MKVTSKFASRSNPKALADGRTFPQPLRLPSCFYRNVFGRLRAIQILAELEIVEHEWPWYRPHAPISLAGTHRGNHGDKKPPDSHPMALRDLTLADTSSYCARFLGVLVRTKYRPRRLEA